MKVMIVIPAFVVGGAENMVFTLVNELKRERIDVFVVVFYLTGSHLEKKLEQEDVNIICINKKLGFDINAIIRLKQIIKEQKPNVIHTHLHTLAYVWLSEKNVHIVHTLHSVASREQTGIRKMLCGLIYRYSRKCTPVALTKEVKDSLVKEFGVKEDRIKIVNNGICLSRYKQKKTYKTNNNEIHLVNVGRFIELKNHKLMIDCLAQLNQNSQIKYYLHFYGDGELKGEIIEQIKDYCLDSFVQLEGISNNIPEELNKYDVFILPSKQEGMPISIIEAMAVGLPIIASRVGGVPDIITDKIDGILIEPRLDQLKNAIVKIAGALDIRKEIGQAAAKNVERFSSMQMAKGYINVYKEKC